MEPPAAFLFRLEEEGEDAAEFTLFGSDGGGPVALMVEFFGGRPRGATVGGEGGP
jgi:hypothetical protein